MVEFAIARRRIAASFVMLTLAASLAGCTVYGQTVATSTPYASGAPVGFESYYEQSIVWTSCGDRLQCATVKAPTDWADPLSGDITIAINRHMATEQPAIGDLVMNPGGPGESAVAFVRESSGRAVDSTLRDQFNIVGIDPRGVGESSPVVCYTDPADLDDALYGVPTGERGSDEWNASVESAVIDFGQACLENTGDLLAHVDTASAARDMDMIRAAMGNEKLNFLGYSYGTFLGATYADLFPERVGRMVLDGAIDPTVPPHDSMYGQVVSFEQALDAYLAWCVDGGDCPLGDTVTEAGLALQVLLADVDAAPIENADGRLLGADTLVTALLWPLYDNASWPQLSDIIAATLNGDPTAAFDSADSYNGRSSDGTYTNTTDAFFAINCVDSPPSDAEIAASIDAQLLADAPILGVYMNTSVDGCASWPVPLLGSLAPIRAVGAPDILILGTTNDPATPYEAAVSLSQQMVSAHLVTLDGEGHTAYNRGYTCIDDIVDAYFLDGVIPVAGITCSA